MELFLPLVALLILMSVSSIGTSEWSFSRSEAGVGNANPALNKSPEASDIA